MAALASSANDTSYSTFVTAPDGLRLHVDAQNNLGAIFLQQKRFGEAIKYFQNALGINRNNSQTNNNIGLALSELHQYDLAIEHFQRALAITPSNVEILCNLGNTLQKCNRYEEALATYERAAALQPNHGAILAANHHRSCLPPLPTIRNGS